jgi:hypothetical protein
MGKRRFVAVMLFCLSISSKSHGQITTMVTAHNPKPAMLPGLSVWEERRNERQLVYVKSSFPNVPNFTCDTWCYESDVEFVDAKEVDGGKVQLRHRWKAHPEVSFVTTVIPEEAAVEFLARPELEPPGSAKLPQFLLNLNACWQLRNAPGFASKPDPYPDFVKRCFIFTDAGLTFLDKTERNKHTRWPPDHQFNNPPWVQVYTPVWRAVMKTPPNSFAAFSAVRYVYPIIGAVSRDGKYLAAIANDTGYNMCQAWHDCMHNNATWTEEKPGARVWRIRIYAMENNPEALLRRVGHDFPKAMTLKENRVEAGPGK